MSAMSETGSFMTFTIDVDNNITVLASSQQIEERQEGIETFSSPHQLAALAAKWPGSCLVEIWNGLPGVEPVERFTRRAVGGDTPHGRGRQVRIRVVQVHTVERVECFGAELHAMTLGDEKRLRHPQIDGHLAGSFQHIPAKISVRARRVLPESVRIE